jgi:cytochrome c biogenesis protein CcmG/thiol:disulfide interchange protein DsbE
MGWQRVATGVIVALAVGFSAYIVAPLIVQSAPRTTVPGRDVVGIQAGDLAPNFTLLSVDGRAVSLKSLRGHAVWLNFWATWCPWCRREMPDMERLAAHYGRRLVIVGIDEQQSASVVRAFLAAHHITYPVLLDSTSSLGTRYDVGGLPVSVFIAPDGHITAYYPGSLLGTHEMVSLAKQAMAGG